MPEPTPAQRAIGDFAPKLVEITDEVLFGDVWERPELAKRDRSLITVASLITSSSFEQLGTHRDAPMWPMPVVRMPISWS